MRHVYIIHAIVNAVGNALYVVIMYCRRRTSPHLGAPTFPPVSVLLFGPRISCIISCSESRFFIAFNHSHLSRRETKADACVTYFDCVPHGLATEVSVNEPRRMGMPEDPKR